jgi:hypothetical protein
MTCHPLGRELSKRPIPSPDENRFCIADTAFVE